MESYQRGSVCSPYIRVNGNSEEYCYPNTAVTTISPPPVGRRHVLQNATPVDSRSFQRVQYNDASGTEGSYHNYSSLAGCTSVVTSSTFCMGHGSSFPQGGSYYYQPSCCYCSHYGEGCCRTYVQDVEDSYTQFLWLQKELFNQGVYVPIGDPVLNMNPLPCVPVDFQGMANRVAREHHNMMSAHMSEYQSYSPPALISGSQISIDGKLYNVIDRVDRSIVKSCPHLQRVDVDESSNEYCSFYIKNIPNRYTVDTLLEEILTKTALDEDDIYGIKLPASGSGRCNFGYAFLHLKRVDALTIEKLLRLNEFGWNKSSLTRKKAKVCYANEQLTLQPEMRLV